MTVGLFRLWYNTAKEYSDNLMIAADLGPKILTARVICADNRGPKVLVCEDGEIIKFFRAGRFLSHRGYLKRAVQFEGNSRLLARLGFRTPTNVQAIDGIAGENTAVRYQPVSGEDVKALIESGEDPGTLCFALGEAHRKLHDQGVVFKANHLANFIFESGQPLGVIDFDNLYKLPFGLPERVRRGNLLRLIRVDPTLVDVSALLEGYVQAGNGPDIERVCAGVLASVG
jgi:hypothetical protein